MNGGRGLTWMAGVLACAAASAAQATVMPSTPDIQRAYVAAKVLNPKTHNDALVVTHSQCEPTSAARAYCQIDFMDRSANNQRLYFTVVTLERSGPAWVLLSGLCLGP